MAFIVRKEDQNTHCILLAQLYKYDNEQLIEVN